MSQPKPEVVYLAEIDFEGSPIVRHEIRQDVVDEYSEFYLLKEPLPPPDLFKTDHRFHYIGDGWHRLTAAKKAGVKQMMCNIHKGDYGDCIRFALKANTHHGLRRSNEDKRAAVETALKAFPNLSNHVIADMAFVSDKMVGDVRQVLENQNTIAPVPRRLGRDKKQYVGSRSENIAPEKTETVKEVLSKPTPTHDSTRHEIPEPLVEVWNRRLEFDELAGYIGNLIDLVTRAAKDRDPLYWELRFTDVLSSLRAVESALADAKPFCVCGQCQGRKESNCVLCRNHGLTSRRLWLTVPEEIRNIRIRADK